MRNSIFEAEKIYELSFGKNEFWPFARKCVIYTFSGKISKFVFSKTQFVDFFRFKNRIPHKNISLPCSQIDIGVPIAIHEFRSFIFFPLSLAEIPLSGNFINMGPTLGPGPYAGGAGGAPPLGPQSSSPQGSIVLIPGGAEIRAATVEEAGE